VKLTGELTEDGKRKVHPKKIAASLRKHGYTALERKRLPRIGQAILWVKGKSAHLLSQVSNSTLADKFKADLDGWTARNDAAAKAENDKDQPF